MQKSILLSCFAAFANESEVRFFFNKRRVQIILNMQRGFQEIVYYEAI